LVIKIIFISSSPFALLIINGKILSNFQKEWYTFGRKKNTFEKNKDFPLLKFECFEHAKENLFVSNFENIKFVITIPKNIMTILCFSCDFSNIQKCSFKDCPFTWVSPLIVFLPFSYWGDQD
jgi:hypothetical protein